MDIHFKQLMDWRLPGLAAMDRAICTRMIPVPFPVFKDFPALGRDPQNSPAPAQNRAMPHIIFVGAPNRFVTTSVELPSDLMSLLR
jgi:hypothetical protein